MGGRPSLGMVAFTMGGGLPKIRVLPYIEHSDVYSYIFLLQKFSPRRVVFIALDQSDQELHSP